MKLFEKVKNMFTEEIEEEKPIKKEIRHVEIPTPKPIEEKPVVEEKKEEPAAPAMGGGMPGMM